MANNLVPKYKQGDIVLVSFPFADDKEKSKQRPVLIISNDAVNSIRYAYLGVKITGSISGNQLVSFILKDGHLEVPMKRA